MFNSLSDYLQQQRDREEALKRKLSQLKPTVRNGEAGEIIAALIDLGSVGAILKKQRTIISMSILHPPAVLMCWW
jgi:hypothetical protein